MQGLLSNCSWTTIFFIVIILPLLQLMEGNELRKGGNHEELTVAYRGQITLQSRRVLLLQFSFY